MKRYMLPLAMSIIGILSARADNEILKITLNNGTSQQLRVSDIDRITFEDTPAAGADSDLLLDVVFNADGTATDRSPLANKVITYPGNSLMTYYNDAYGCYVANFTNPLTATVTDSYYRVNYTAGGDFINRIADGCTLETIIKLNETNPGTAEVKWFGSIQVGGIGFLLPIHSNVAGTKCITFLPNVSTTGSSKYIWTFSDVEPRVGTYYHVVGVYNKDLGKSFVYINGRLAGQADAPGNYVPVGAGGESFVIGGDPANNQTQCTNSWNGEIVAARIYDTPYDAEQVGSLWNRVPDVSQVESLTVTDLVYLPSCEAKAGWAYRVYGKGFKEGDVVELVKVADGQVTKPETKVEDDALCITIPTGMTTGDYRVMVRRGTAQAPLGVVSFTIGDNPMEVQTPKTIAHRGAHTDGRSENSIAALEAALEANYYGIELDTWITTDGQVVVHHDGVVNGVNFMDCTYDQIKDIKLSNGESLPTFDSFVETFDRYRDRSTSKLIIEVKTHYPYSRSQACVDRVLELLKERGLEDRVEFIAFDYNVCKYIHSKGADFMIGYLMGDKAPATCLADGIRSIDYSYAAYGTHPEYIKQARDLGMTVNVWTINTPAEILKYWAMGAHYITTDTPATIRELERYRFVESM